MRFTVVQWLDGISELEALEVFSRQSRKWGYVELANASATHFSNGPKLGSLKPPPKPTKSTVRDAKIS